jgi:hypothetical protein
MVRHPVTKAFSFRAEQPTPFWANRQYRMNTLLALKKDLRTELQLMNEFAEENLKSYQVW